VNESKEIINSFVQDAKCAKGEFQDIVGKHGVPMTIVVVGFVFVVGFCILAASF